jgi:hypothetical protein
MTIMLKKGKQQLESDIIYEFGRIAEDMNHHIIHDLLRREHFTLKSANNIEINLDQIVKDTIRTTCTAIAYRLCKVINENLYTQEDMEKDLGL